MCCRRLRLRLISIHAPRVGSDCRGHARPWRMHPYFNPRSPCGERPALGSHTVESYRFQSTLPVWGATMIKRRYINVTAISIHAPRVGSDQYKCYTVITVKISIHAPRVGSDVACGAYNSPPPGFQSTLPVWGATSCVRPARHAWPYFNPRSPCGERLSTSMPKKWGDRFQSTLPVWGATKNLTDLTQEENISIHAPRVGSDPRAYGSCQSGPDFNPRSPCGERRYDTAN